MTQDVSQTSHVLKVGSRNSRFVGSMDSLLAETVELELNITDGAGPAPFSDKREGHCDYSLYVSAGSHNVQSTGSFPARDTKYYGSEGSGPDAIGTSKYEFSEWVRFSTATGKLIYSGGTVQNLAGVIAVAGNGGQVWSGKFHERYTTASASHYVTTSIRRKRLPASVFHLIIVPVSPFFNDVSNAGSHKLQIFDDSLNTLVQEQDLLFTDDPHNHLDGILDAHTLVGMGNFMRVDVVAQLALADGGPARPLPVAGGAQFGIGFVDSVP